MKIICNPNLRKPSAASLWGLRALLFLAVAGAHSCAPYGGVKPVPALSGGIQVNEPDHGRWVAAVQAAGLDSIQVTAYARQVRWDSAEMILPTEVPAVVNEIRSARRAGLRVVLVLRVALEHGIADNRHLWHGMIWPPEDQVQAWFDRYREFLVWGARLAERERVDLLAVGSELNSLTSTVQVQELPNLYVYFLDPKRTGEVRTRLVDCASRVPAEYLEPDLEFRDGTRYENLDSYLRAAEEANRAWARRITVASSGPPDLDALNRRRADYEKRWRQLIVEARRHYRGPLTYAANFDQVEEVGFWDALDAIGVNAYYSLSRLGLSGTVLDKELASSWRRIAGRLHALGRDAGKPGVPLPVIFLELGWTTKSGSTVRPFSYHRVEVLESVGDSVDGSPLLTCVHWATQTEDPGERVRAIAALLEIVRAGSFPTLRGFTLWKLSTQFQHRAVEPFVVVLPTPGGTIADAPSAGQPELTQLFAEQKDVNEADRRYLRVAAELATALRNAASIQK